MNELSALRRLAMSSAKVCAAIHRRASGTDHGIAQVLNSSGALASIIAAAHRISLQDVDSMIAPLITSQTPTPAPTPGDIEHVRFMNAYA